MRNIYVPDMSCKHCVKRITEALEKAGFSNFEISLEAKKIVAEVSDEEVGRIISILDEEGYSPTEATI